MIIGIGCDIVEIHRIAHVIKQYGDHFLSRIFCDEERKIAAQKREQNTFYAGRFAAKEALAKALGSGIGLHLSWQDMDIRQDEKGKPIVIWNPTIVDTFSIAHTHISISHSERYAIAYALLER